jgi:hypothetical protein
MDDDTKAKIDKQRGVTIRWLRQPVARLSAGDLWLSATMKTPQSFPRQESQHKKATMADSIQLTNGHMVQFDREHWTGLASQECDCLTATGRNITPRLAVLKHTDGRVLVYGTVKDGQKMSAAGGELLASQERKPLAAALGRLVAQFSRGPFLLKQCLSQIDSGPVVRGA